MNNEYKIEKLNYNLNDIKEIDIKTLNLQMQLYKDYIDELNNLLKKNNYDYKYEMEDLVNYIEIFPIDERDDILYNLGGALNHKEYFNSINPYNKNVLNGKIKDAINNKYGSFSNFKNIFIDTAKKLIGSGYTYLVIDSNNNLNIINLTNEETPYTYGFTPLITIDLWEHAYLFKYNLNKEKYIKNIFNIIDFDSVNKSYENIVDNK